MAHRLSTVADADQILVLEHGRLIGAGNHDYLLTHVPLYRRLANEQHMVTAGDAGRRTPTPRTPPDSRRERAQPVAPGDAKTTKRTQQQGIRSHEKK